METDWSAATDEECTIAARKTNSYLRNAAKFAVQNGLPLCIASTWSNRAMSNDAPGRLSNRICCRTCGLDLRNRRCFDVKIDEIDGVRSVKGFCCGCKQAYRCGEIQFPSCSEDSVDPETSMDSSGLFDKTFDEGSIRAVSTPMSSGKSFSLASPRLSNMKNQSKKSGKRRGSALERLLKEEDPEVDRSLSGFLSMVSR
ncbi:hypothetical protein Q1695_007269 [Nippostrongylus brasiliensis]|nr:hypothetical protein Q1695_007269 [Nippostrongylus brasiliensis]